MVRYHTDTTELPPQKTEKLAEDLKRLAELLRQLMAKPLPPMHTEN